MAIVYQKNEKIFHLQANDTSYILQLVKSGHLAHLYWGKRLRNSDYSYLLRFRKRPLTANPDPQDYLFSLDTLPQEYPGYGNSDFRTPVYQIQLENGSTVTDLKYQSHCILKGKPVLQGLPATYAENEAEAETLKIELVDSLIGLKVILAYTTFEKSNVITRSVCFVNEGSQKLKLLRALSMNIDFSDADYDLLQLTGAWGRERDFERIALKTGMQSIESRRGASSPQCNPFMALLRKDTTEDFGEIYGFSLVYSGNFLGQVEVDQYKTTRISLGINPFDFSWMLEPGQSFQTPEVVMVYSDLGIGDMSRIYHRLYRSRLCRGKYRNKTRPILLNSWEATYFDFNAEKIENIARAGKELGIELFVLDDGWFGKRNNDKSSLGDWVVDKAKLPNGIEDLVGRINKLEMAFGLWFEPEMISPDSDLYREHPDWCLHVPNRSRTPGRNQLVLDLTREDVCEAVIKMLSDILSSAPISYVKWDMNRHMTEIGSATLPPERQRETAHRYMLGLYRIMETITSAFPEILFESCSSGGGRFDPGMLYYMPQTWTSDNTDAVARLKIQYGTSIVYPTITMGAHVSAVPNHQVQRTSPLEIRGTVATSGNLGYELDPVKLTPVEKDIIKKQIELYKDVRQLVQFGDFYRLMNPFEGNETAWMFVSEDQTEAFISYFRVLAEPNPPLTRLRLKGLNTMFNYQVEGIGRSFGGDELMHIGLDIPDSILKGDFQSFTWRIQTESNS